MKYDHALCRLTNLGLPPEVVKPILAKVNLWIESCGPEWTVTRLKELKTWYIHMLSNQQYVPSVWIAGKDGKPKGCFKPIFTMKPGMKSFNTLMIYTSFTLKSVSKNQKEKFFNSVASSPVVLPHIPHLKEVVRSVDHLVPERIVKGLEDYPFSDKKRAPLGKTKTTVEGPENIFDDVKSQYVCDIIDKYDISEMIGRCWLKVLFSDGYDTDPTDDTVGRISVVQEPGCKARFLANPKRIFQVALRPLGRQLLGLIKQLPWDCTHRQHEGIEWVQTQLNADKIVHSVDLSDATNNFPLSLQMRVLSWLENVNSQDVSLFEHISKGNWYVPLALRSMHTIDGVKWTKGQPLGLYPSFMAFALTHGCLVRSFEVSLGLNDTFRILGDDIVISNDDVANMYYHYLDLLEIPISKNKTIVSNCVAEFAGALITPKQCYLGSKWRAPTESNLTSLLSTLPRKLDLEDKEEFIAFLFKSAPKPYGLGMNTEGLPLMTRCIFFLPWYLNTLEEDDHWVRSSYESWLYKLPLKPPDPLNILSYEKTNEQISNVLSEWLIKHPYTPIDISAHNSPDQDVLRFWLKLVKIFRFGDIRLPTGLQGKTMEWLRREMNLKYTRQIVDDAMYPKLRGIGKYLYRTQYKHQLCWKKWGWHTREYILRDIMRDCFDVTKDANWVIPK